MALHNFIRDSYLGDEDFDLVDSDENFVPLSEASSSQVSNTRHGDEDHTMNQFRDSIADGLFNRA